MVFRTRIFSVSALMCSVLIASPSLAQAPPSVEARPDGSVTWQAGVDGVEIEFDQNGKIRRIYSKYAQAVTFDDRRGIQTARTIAEGKAKANIVRFMEQHVETGRVVGEVEATISKATQEKAGDKTSRSQIDQRTVSQSLTEFSNSVSRGVLKGVVVLENGYDEKTHEAWVVVGVSQKAIEAANATKEMTSGRPGSDRIPGAAEGNTGAIAPSDRVPSEIRRGNQGF